MELTNAQKTKTSQWVVMVNGDPWGYTTTENNAKHYLTEISQNIYKTIHVDNPNTKINLINKDNKTIQITTVQTGWVYNTTGETINITIFPIYKLRTPPGAADNLQQPKLKFKNNRRRRNNKWR